MSSHGGGSRPGARASATLTGINEEGRDVTASAPLLFVVLEGGHPSRAPARHSLLSVEEVRIGRGDVRSTKRVYRDGKRLLLVQLDDRSVSSDHARIVVGKSSCMLVDRRSKNGTMLNGHRCETAALADQDVISIGRTSLLFYSRAPRRLQDCMDIEGDDLDGPRALWTMQPALSTQFEMLATIARSKRTVLLNGATGTGKERVARAIHTMSHRSGPFVPVNCGAISDSLLEGELFGYRKGAFSGAVEDREGLIVAADKGTLFLDEVAELSPKGQASLLRVLQEHEVRALGTTTARSVDLRVLVATHRNLETEVAEGRFREDLYGRIADFVVQLPALEDRLEDLGLLIRNMLSDRRVIERDGIQLSTAACRALFRHRWPRNIRELERCIAAAAVLAPDGVIRLEHLPDTVRGVGLPDDAPMAPPSLRGSADATGPMPRIVGAGLDKPISPRPSPPAAAAVPSPAPQPAPAPARKARKPLSDEDEARREVLLALLEEHKGNVSRVGEAMGKHRQQIQKWLRRYGIDPKPFRR